MICLDSNYTVPLVYDLSFRLNTFYLTLTRPAEEYLNVRIMSDGRIRRSGFLQTSEHGFGIGNVLRPDRVSVSHLPVTEGAVSTWSFETGKGCDIGSIRNFLNTVGIVASVLREFKAPDDGGGLSQLLTIGGISCHPNNLSFILNVTLSHEVMNSWRSRTPIEDRPDQLLTDDLMASIRRHVWHGDVFDHEQPRIRRSEDGHIESIIFGASGAGLERCRQFFSGHGAIFCQRSIVSLEQQVVLLCLMSELAALARTSLKE